MPNKKPSTGKKNDIDDYDIQITIDSEGHHKIQILGIDKSGSKMILKEGINIPKTIEVPHETYASPEPKGKLFSKEVIGAFLVGFLAGGTVVYFVGSSRDSSYVSRIKELEKINQTLQKKITTPAPQYYGYRPPPPSTEEQTRSNLIRSYNKFDSGLDLYGKSHIY